MSHSKDKARLCHILRDFSIPALTTENVDKYLNNVNSKLTNGREDTVVFKTLDAFYGTKIRITHDFVRNIFVNAEEKIVVVVFSDKEKEVVRCSENDEFDVAVGVALAVCRRLFGHTTFYKKIVGKKTTYQQKREKKVANSDYVAYLKWCEANKKRKVAEATFKKNKYKYLARMKGEN